MSFKRVTSFACLFLSLSLSLSLYLFIYLSLQREDPTKSRGFGFVTFDDPADALRAKAALDGKQLDGRTLRVDDR